MFTFSFFFFFFSVFQLSPMSSVKFQYLNCKSAIVSEVNEIKKKSPNSFEGHFVLLGYADATVAAVCAEAMFISHDLDVPFSHFLLPLDVSHSVRSHQKWKWCACSWL